MLPLCFELTGKVVVYPGEIVSAHHGKFFPTYIDVCEC